MKLIKILCALMVVLVISLLGDGPVTGEETGAGSISGSVLDAKSGQPLAFANIVLVGTSMGAMSLEDGKFRVSRIPAGTYTVKVMMMGYKPAEQCSVVVRPDEMTMLSFRMVETIVMKTQVIKVTGERPMVDVTTSRALIKKGVKDMPMDGFLESMVKKSGSVRMGDDLHVRGGRSGEVQYQIDGTPVDDPLGGGAAKTSACFSLKPGRARPNRNNCPPPVHREPFNTESYDPIFEGEYLETIENPYSTFSIDVDAASYSNVRRFIRSGHRPPPDAVRVEEMINYFTYDYPEPEDSRPFSICTEVNVCPWNTGNRLVHIGLQGRHLDMSEAPANNLVFLLDVSGSMAPPNKLPLLKKAFLMLVEHLRPEDRVAIVVYSGAAQVVLESTPGDEKKTIIDAIKFLHAGGSTAGGAGIKLAYDIAAKNFVEDGNNRVLLATDGDFNIGPSSNSEMVRLIEERREEGVFLTVLGFGEANLKDDKLEKIADHGNGHYAYIDDLFEARKVLVSEFGATMFTIAKDIKIQVEFNPARVKWYRLIGYENRMLAKKDFDDDKKDAGEIGAGHSVTALYEIVPVTDEPVADQSRQSTYTMVSISPEAFESRDLLTVRFRYKEPDEDVSQLISRTLKDNDVFLDDASDDFRFAAAVAEFSLLLRESKFKGDSRYQQVLDLAKSSTGKDEGGYRHEFVRLVEMYKEIAGR